MSPTPTPRLRLLIADDSSAHREAVHRELGALDIEIEFASNGIGALKMIKLFKPDLVTLDIEMPDLNGYRVLEQLRSHESTMTVPVIMISGKHDENERLRALEGGAVEYFSKPFPAGQLRELVEQILTRLTSNRETSVFCLDSDRAAPESMERRLRTHGFRFRAFESPHELLAELEKNPCELLLLDLHLPEQGSYHVLDFVNANRDHVNIEVIGLTSLATRGELIHAYQLGISDFLRKPFMGEELLARVDHLLQVRRRHAKLERLAVIDLLTGLPNRADLARRLPAELSRAVRDGKDVGVLMIDIDHFKKLNDTFGHPFGDKVLHGAAQAMVQGLRASDLLVRYGGEEFLLLAWDANVPGLRLVAERLRRRVSALEFIDEKDPVRVTVSIGACLWEHAKLRRDHALLELVKPADVALYRAKENGRNQVCFGEASSAP